MTQLWLIVVLGAFSSCCCCCCGGQALLPLKVSLDEVARGTKVTAQEDVQRIDKEAGLRQAPYDGQTEDAVPPKLTRMCQKAETDDGRLRYGLETLTVNRFSCVIPDHPHS